MIGLFINSLYSNFNIEHTNTKYFSAVSNDSNTWLRNEDNILCFVSNLLTTLMQITIESLLDQWGLKYYHVFNVQCTKMKKIQFWYDLSGVKTVGECIMNEGEEL